MSHGRTRQATIRRKRKFLQRAQTYPGQVRPVELIETHFAWVFLTELHAYKLKKPMRQDVMDYRTIAARARGCRNEVRLNRRLAPSVYLGVVPLGCERDGRLVLGPAARSVDWLVKMRRLNAARMLDRSIAAHAVTDTDLHNLGALFARFYATARSEPMERAGYLAHLRRQVFDNLRALQAPELCMTASRVEEVIDAQLQFIAGNSRLLAARGARLIEGHGDLRPEHVYLGSGSDAPCVIDCLEFDPRLRRLDPAEELAFLTLECSRLGAFGFAADLLHRIGSALGDPVPDALLFFYMSHRAVVRAKITAWHLRDLNLRPRVRHWKARANSYLQDALHFAHLAGSCALNIATRPSGSRIPPSSLSTAASRES